MAMPVYYRTSLTDPQVRAAYDRYKRRLNPPVPDRFPLSDEQRRDFDEKYIQYMKQMQELYRKEKNTR